MVRYSFNSSNSSSMRSRDSTPSMASSISVMSVRSSTSSGSRSSGKSSSWVDVKTARASVMAHFQSVAEAAKTNREASAPNSRVWWAAACRPDKDTEGSLQRAVADKRLQEAARLADEMSAELERQRAAEAARQQAE